MTTQILISRPQKRSLYHPFLILGHFFCVALIAISLSGCATLGDYITFGDENTADVQYPAEQLAIKGMSEYNIGKYFLALDYFEEILDKHPFSPQSTLAELKAADCNFFLEKYAEAFLQYEEFEERHPTNEAIPYVMYQKGMCNYVRIGRIDRDVSGAYNSIENFTQLLKAYPRSPYTAEVTARIRAANEFLVNHEFFVVQFYLRTEKFNQAEARLKYLIATHPNTSIIPQAKVLLQQIEEGEPPKSPFFSWAPNLSLPNWIPFMGKSAVEEKE